LLQVVAERKHDRPGRLLVERRRDVAHPQLGVTPDQLVVVRALHPDAPEQERLVPHDLLVQLTVWVHALEVELGVVPDPLRLREHHTVGGDDRPSGLVDIGERGARVARVVPEVLGVDDLEIRELSHEDEHHHDHGGADATDGAVHVVTPRPAEAGRAPRWAVAARARALSSDMRKSNARITKLATSDDPP
jgi:hypothetical protein